MDSVRTSKLSVITPSVEVEEIEEELIVESDEDLLHKNTSSFKCLTQIEISRSSILRDPLYHFQELEDPHLEEALWATEIPVIYDNIGEQRYKDLCKAEKIIPFKRVIRSLPGTCLNLKFYGLNEKEMKTICQTLEHNVFIKEFYLQENWLKPGLVKYLAKVLIHNQTISVLDLKLCEIGPFGAEALTSAIQLNKTLVELDLSYNGLGNEGIMYLAKGLQQNTSIRILNLSHNDLGEQALIELRPVVEDNYMIRELDLSWNYLFSPLGMKQLMEGLVENIGLFKLNLSWNGIGEKDTVKEIMIYLKSENSRIRHLDLSNNRITGISLKMLYAGLKPNENLEYLNIGYNPLTADEVEFFANAFFEPKDICNLNTLDFGSSWVNKSFIRLKNRIKRKGCTVIYGGIYSNYKIKGPVVKELLLNRAKYVAMKQKQKKKRKDIGEFIVQLKDDPMPKDEFEALIKKGKIKLDADLMKILLKNFEDKQKKIDVVNLKEVYLKLYPDTKPPEKVKKAKGRKKKSK